MIGRMNLVDLCVCYVRDHSAGGCIIIFFGNNRNGSLGFKALMPATAHIIVSHLLRVPPHGVYPTVQTFCGSAVRNGRTIIC